MSFDLRKAIIEMHQIRNADKSYFIFFDETNNIKKLRLNNGKFNVSNDTCFALGGIASENFIRAPSLNFLINTIGLQPNINELKREYLGKGDFPKIISSRKLKKFLKWLLSQEYFVHFNVVDPLYWGVVDIIEEVNKNIDLSAIQQYLLSQCSKSDLHRVIQANILQTEQIFSSFNFPNVEHKKIPTFYTELKNMVDASLCLDDFNKKMLSDMLKSGSSIEDFSFLGSDEAETLLESFDSFYANKIMLFKNATIIFDNEGDISETLKAESYKAIIGESSNYTFKDSKLDMHIQISDLIIGTIGKYFSYLNSNDLESIHSFLEGATDIQKSNIMDMKEIITRSDNESNAFIHYVASPYLVHKQRTVWEYFS